MILSFPLRKGSLRVKFKIPEEQNRNVSVWLAVKVVSSGLAVLLRRLARCWTIAY